MDGGADGHLTLAGILRGHARGRPDRVALLDAGTGEQVRFAELDERSSRVAQALAGSGVQRGDRVAFLDLNGVEYFEVAFGVAKLGAVLVAVNWRLAPREMAFIVRDSRAPVLVVGPELAPAVEAFEDDLSHVRQVIAVGGHDRWTSYAAWRDAAPADDPGIEPDRDEVSQQLYTSGTTGLPKGVMLTNAGLSALLPNAVGPWQLDGSSVNLVAMPLFHIGGSGWAFCGLYAGCTSVIVRTFDPAQVLDVLVAHGVTNALFVPAMLQAMTLGVPGADEREFPALRRVHYAASPITARVLTAAMDVFGCGFVQLYGATETSGAITELAAEDHDPQDRPELLRSAGRAYPWVELQVRDVVTREPLPPGEVGEVVTRSEQNFVGYHGRPQETAAVFDEDGWLRTGDAGYLDADGYLFLTDRIKDMIVTGGENVYPIEVENVLIDHPDVADVAVIGVPDDTWGEAVKAVVVPREGALIDEVAVLGWVRERVAGFKTPTSLDVVAELPRNAAGKLLKRELRAPFWEGRERSIG